MIRRRASMKQICTVAAAVIFTALTVLVASARKSDAILQAAQTLPDSKVAIVDTEEFGDPKTGIARLTSAFGVIDREIKPKRDELQQMQTRYDQLVKEINATTAVADQKALATKSEQAETLQKDIKR